MKRAYIQCISSYLPDNVEMNDPAAKTTKKLGITKRHISLKGECASDLAFNSAKKLFAQHEILPQDIDFLLLCTQSPDYFLPTTACVLQHRLGLRTNIGAFDFNLGCSGFVYGLSIAKGLIETGQAGKVLLITAETYSKYINPQDNGVKPIFGDGAAATLISAKDQSEEAIHSFVFGTDGLGASNLIVPAGGLRNPVTDADKVEIEDDFGNVRSRCNLYMNGPEIFSFTLEQVPATFHEVIRKSKMSMDSIDRFVFHQANMFMVEHLRKVLNIPESRFSICMDDGGNTVSSTIPITLENEFLQGTLVPGNTAMLLGFGVGYSWAGCLIKI